MEQLAVCPVSETGSDAASRSYPSGWSEVPLILLCPSGWRSHQYPLYPWGYPGNLSRVHSFPGVQHKLELSGLLHVKGLGGYPSGEQAESWEGSEEVP